MQRQCEEVMVGGEPRLFEYSYETSIAGPPRKITWEVYKRPDGSLFSLPIDDAGPGSETRSAVSRDATTGRGSVNKYLNRGFKWATMADRKAALERAEANAKADEERKKLRDPAELEKYRAALQAQANADMMKQIMASARGGK